MKRAILKKRAGRAKPRGGENSARLPHRSPTAPLRVLLVDDEPNVRQAVALVLSVDGHKVTESASGPLALQRLETEQFDIVITDFRMQGMNGDELARRIKARHPTLPVVMLTGFSEQPIGPENPVCAIFYKPDQITSLRQMVGTLCHN
jgi:CheY-like chemotaxis protein